MVLGESNHRLGGLENCYITSRIWTYLQSELHVEKNIKYDVTIPLCSYWFFILKNVVIEFMKDR